MAAYGQLQVGHGPEAVVQRRAAIIYHVLYGEVVSCGPALKMLIPEENVRRRNKTLTLVLRLKMEKGNLMKHKGVAK